MLYTILNMVENGPKRGMGEEEIQALSDATASGTAIWHRHLAELGSPSVDTPENQQKAKAAADQIQRASLDHLQVRTTILLTTCPDILDDAYRFIGKTAGCMPWNLLPDDEEAEVIAFKYGARWSRQRPDPAEVSPVTDIFYECAETARNWYFLVRNNPSVAEQILGNMSAQMNERFQQRLAVLSPEEREKYNFTEEDKTELQAIYKLSRIASNRLNWEEQLDADYHRSVALDRRWNPAEVTDEA